MPTYVCSAAIGRLTPVQKAEIVVSVMGPPPAISLLIGDDDLRAFDFRRKERLLCGWTAVGIVNKAAQEGRDGTFEKRGPSPSAMVGCADRDFPRERQSPATFGYLKNAKESYAVSVPRTLRSALLSSPLFRFLAADPSKHSKRTPSLASFSSRNNGKYAFFTSFSIASS